MCGRSVANVDFLFLASTTVFTQVFIVIVTILLLLLLIIINNYCGTVHAYIIAALK